MDEQNVLKKIQQGDDITIRCTLFRVVSITEKENGVYSLDLKRTTEIGENNED